MFQRVVRYLSALLLLMYGFAKINGSQFTTLDSDLDKPLGHVSGVALTWYYFGYSVAYKTFIAGLEIGGGLLLTFDRTAFLGACVLAPVLANIVLIDIFYGIHPSGTVTAIVLLIAMLYLLAPRRKEVIAFFLPPSTGRQNSIWRTGGQWAARVAMIALTFGATYWVAHYNNRFPTPVDGVWDVVGVEPANAASQLPVTVFFEFNGAFLAVLKSSSGDYSQHDFEVDTRVHRIRLWEKWLDNGATIFDGVYALDGSRLTLNGNWRGAGDLVLKLSRRKIRP